MRQLNGPPKIKWQMTVFSNSIDLFVSMNGSEIKDYYSLCDSIL